MFFGKKEEKGKLPDLPPLKTKFGMPPRMDSPHEEMEEVHTLPTFPDSPMLNKFSQVAIKDAVQTRGEEMHPEFPVVNSGARTMEMEEWMPADFKVQKVPDIGMRNERSYMPEPSPSIATSGPVNNDVFVKIDKFHTARKTLKDVSDKLEEIDELIKKIRETKMGEEQEISGWESDIAAVKTRLNDVVENIFEKA